MDFRDPDIMLFSAFTITIFSPFSRSFATVDASLPMISFLASIIFIVVTL